MNDNNTPQRINFYAAFGISLAVSLAIIIVLTAGTLLSSQLLPYGYNDQQLVLLMLIFLGAVLFFGLATLLGSKYGWRTVVMSFVVQGFVLLFALLIFSMVLQKSDRYNDRSPTLYDGPSLAQ